MTCTLKIEFKSNKLKQACEEYHVSVRIYNEEMACKIAQRMAELKDADSVEMLVQFSVGRCHSLKGKRNGQYAMDLVHPFRLIFEKKKIYYRW